MHREVCRLRTAAAALCRCRVRGWQCAGWLCLTPSVSPPEPPVPIRFWGTRINQAASLPRRLAAALGGSNRCGEDLVESGIADDGIVERGVVTAVGRGLGGNARLDWDDDAPLDDSIVGDPRLD